MNALHPADHETRLEPVLLGEDPRPEELEACPACGPRLERLRAIAASLDAAGATERELVAQALAADAAPGEDRLAATVREALAAGRGPERPARGARFGFVVGVATALAAGLLALVVLWPRDGGAGAGAGAALPGPDVYLGDEDLVPLAPVGAVGAYDAFRWEHVDAPRRATYYVTVYDDAGNELGRSPRLRTAEWVAPPAAAGWPDRIRWEVAAFDPTGGDLGSASADAWR